MFVCNNNNNKFWSRAVAKLFTLTLTVYPIQKHKQTQQQHTHTQNIESSTLPQNIFFLWTERERDKKKHNQQTNKPNHKTKHPTKNIQHQTKNQKPKPINKNTTYIVVVSSLVSSLTHGFWHWALGNTTMTTMTTMTTTTTIKGNNGAAYKRRQFQRLGVIIFVKVVIVVIVIVPIMYWINNNKNNTNNNKMASSSLRRSIFRQRYNQQQQQHETMTNEQVLELILQGEIQLTNLMFPNRELLHKLLSQEQQQQQHSQQKLMDYTGLFRGIFCHVDWSWHEQDPSQTPMFRDVLSSSHCQSGSLMTHEMDLYQVVQATRLYNAKLQQQQEPKQEQKQQQPKQEQQQQPKQQKESVHIVDLAGFVFHESRCGSTLIANLLQWHNPKENIVYSESTNHGLIIHDIILYNIVNNNNITFDCTNFTRCYLSHVTNQSIL